MAYLTESQVRALAVEGTRVTRKTASQLLTSAFATDQSFDVFLSHSSAEPEEIILGIKILLEQNGLTVYVDRYGDPQLSASNVTPETAAILRQRMRHSKALLYVHSQHSKRSRWMPWELGYFDGFRGFVGIIPVTRNQEDSFKGEEYLNLYPYVDEGLIEGTQQTVLWINKSAKYYAQLGKWVTGSAKIRLHG